MGWIEHDRRGRKINVDNGKVWHKGGDGGSGAEHPDRGTVFFFFFF
jgi:hypothetical protein